MSVPCIAPVAPAAGLFDPVIVDNFAGLGGASFGIKLGSGRSVDVCVNHCPRALQYRALNHPETRHLQSDVWEVDPFEAVGWDTVVHVRPGRRRPSHRRLRLGPGAAAPERRRARARQARHTRDGADPGAQGRDVQAVGAEPRARGLRGRVEIAGCCGLRRAAAPAATLRDRPPG